MSEFKKETIETLKLLCKSQNKSLDYIADIYLRLIKLQREIYEIYLPKPKNKDHIIKHCLEYCLHRIDKHKNAGILEIVDREDIKNLLKEINGKGSNS